MEKVTTLPMLADCKSSIGSIGNSSSNTRSNSISSVDYISRDASWPQAVLHWGFARQLNPVL